MGAHSRPAGIARATIRREQCLFFGKPAARVHSCCEHRPSVPNDPDFRALFDAHAAFVWRVLARHGVHARDLPDACQEVFVVVHRRLGEFDGQAALRSWLYGIAVRVAQGQRRRAHRRHELLDAAPPETASEHTPAHDLERSELKRQLERAIAALSDERREVFVLYELENMTMAEVARALGVPENTALYRLYAARDAVRAALVRDERPWPSERRAAGRTA